MTTQSRMQQIDTLANYPMGTKPDSFRLIKKTFKSGEPMKTKIICFIAFVSYTFYLTAGDIYVSPYGNDNAAVWGIERSGFFNGREKWAKGFENQRV